MGLFLKSGFTCPISPFLRCPKIVFLSLAVLIESELWAVMLAVAVFFDYRSLNRPPPLATALIWVNINMLKAPKIVIVSI